jgi:CRAL/TRIO, N-terminal domain
VQSQKHWVSKMTEVAVQPNAEALSPSQADDVSGAMKEMKLSNGQASSDSTESHIHVSSEDLKLPLSAADGLIKTPFAAPLDASKPTSRPPLTTDQEKLYEALLERVSAWTKLPTASAKSSPESPLTDSERLFLTRECLLRYLRATNWNAVQAETRLKATVVWRREYGVEKLTSEYIEIENATGTVMRDVQSSWRNNNFGVH